MDETSKNVVSDECIRVLPAEFLSGICTSPDYSTTCGTNSSRDKELRPTDVPQRAEACAGGRANADAHPHTCSPAVSPYNAPPHTSDRGFSILCEDCRKPYSVKRDRPNRRSRSLCPTCRGRAGAAASDIAADFTCPESDKAERIRAQAIVNMRLRRGWFTRPDTCCLCPAHQKPQRVLAHHQDYKKPDEVWWVCDKHHFAVHREPKVLDGIAPFRCDRVNLPPVKRHSKGGRCGPTGKAAGRSPNRSIVRVSEVLGRLHETLSCGHVFTRLDDGHRPDQRRCRECNSLSPFAASARGEQ